MTLPALKAANVMAPLSDDGRLQMNDNQSQRKSASRHRVFNGNDPLPTCADRNEQSFSVFHPPHPPDEKRNLGLKNETQGRARWETPPIWFSPFRLSPCGKNW